MWRRGSWGWYYSEDGRRKPRKRCPGCRVLLHPPLPCDSCVAQMPLLPTEVEEVSPER